MTTLAAAPTTVLASIPSPSSGRLELGPLSLNAYGLMIALGVVAAVWLFGRRLEERNIGTREDANAIAVWGVIAGVIGARIYHVATDWELFEGDWWRRVRDLAGRPGHPRRDARRGPRRNLGRQAAGDPARPRPQRRRPVAAARPGDRSVGQLLQPGAVRPPDDAAVGAGDRRPAPAERRPVPAGDDVPPDVPLRVAVEPAAVRCAAVDRQALPVGQRTAGRDLRPRLRDRPAAGSRACASTRPTTCSACAGTCGCRSC